MRKYRPNRVWSWRCLRLDVDLTMTNRPFVMVDPERKWIAISWGNGWSDPVWSFQIGPWHR